MKILFITDLYPINTGEITTPVTLHNFVFEWIKQGHTVDVIKPNFIFNSFLRGKPFYKTGFYSYKEVKIFNVNYFTPFWFNVLKKLPEELNLRSYDVIIAHMPSGIIFGGKCWINAGKNKNLICGVHYSDIEILTNPIYKFYFRSQLKNAYKNAKRIACRSFVLQKKFNELMPEFAEKTFVASSGIDIDAKMQRCKDAKKSYASLHPGFYASVLTCANLIKRKNIDKLILAINDLEDFELTVIGDGKELRHLKKISSKNVKFSGRLEHEKVLEEMQKANIFILPSVNETFGMVYLEAIASGCITVCTKNDGIDGIIKDDENGFLCEPTIESIKETLLKIKNSENIEKVVENSFGIIKEYTQEACAKNYMENLNN